MCTAWAGAERAALSWALCHQSGPVMIFGEASPDSCMHTATPPLSSPEHSIYCGNFLQRTRSSLCALSWSLEDLQAPSPRATHWHPGLSSGLIPSASSRRALFYAAWFNVERIAVKAA